MISIGHGAICPLEIYVYILILKPNLTIFWSALFENNSKTNSATLNLSYSEVVFFIYWILDNDYSLVFLSVPAKCFLPFKVTCK